MGLLRGCETSRMFVASSRGESRATVAAQGKKVIEFEKERKLRSQLKRRYIICRHAWLLGLRRSFTLNCVIFSLGSSNKASTIGSSARAGRYCRYCRYCRYLRQTISHCTHHCRCRPPESLAGRRQSQCCCCFRAETGHVCSRQIDVDVDRFKVYNRQIDKYITQPMEGNFYFI